MTRPHGYVQGDTQLSSAGVDTALPGTLGTKASSGKVYSYSIALMFAKNYL